MTRKLRLLESDSLRRLHPQPLKPLNEMWLSKLDSSCFRASLPVSMHVWCVLHILLGSFTFAFSPYCYFLLAFIPFHLPPHRSDARPQLPSCLPKRRSLVSRSQLRPTLSTVCTRTLTSRSRSLSGCRGNGSHSSKTRRRGPNPLSTRPSSLP